eukprot:TRINITY_DN23852_c0_g1_i1.p1 TRINITY_DN23852_c0_g1~~TRINITY_DN23852_c0_g1_i1.p1  ORF type:complete len:258 (-),score=39.02 TRINITY_DN23852_c0_g1_i1:358-1131(-)
MQAMARCERHESGAAIGGVEGMDPCLGHMGASGRGEFPDCALDDPKNPPSAAPSTELSVTPEARSMRMSEGDGLKPRSIKPEPRVRSKTSSCNSDAPRRRSVKPTPRIRHGRNDLEVAVPETNGQRDAAALEEPLTEAANVDDRQDDAVTEPRDQNAVDFTGSPRRLGDAGVTDAFQRVHEGAMPETADLQEFEVRGTGLSHLPAFGGVRFNEEYPWRQQIDADVASHSSNHYVQAYTFGDLESALLLMELPENDEI